MTPKGRTLLKQRLSYLLILVLAGSILIWAYPRAKPEWVFFRNAEASFRKRDYARAADFYSEAVDRGLRNTPVFVRLMELAAIYKDKGELDRAEKLYRIVLAHKKDEQAVPPTEHAKDIPDWVARRELARVLFYLKRYEESINEYRKLVAEKPGLHEARVEMAEVFFAAGLSGEAMKVLKEVPPEKLGEKGRLLMAEVHVSNKEFDRAETLYRELLGRNPSNREVRLKLAEVLAWSKKYEESISEYRRALAAEPGDIQARRRYAFVLIWAGRFEEAAEELRKTFK